jgi:PAS domain S-box-containing protein
MMINESNSNSIEELRRENKSLCTRLEEITEVLAAIRTGAVDALVVEGQDGVEQVFTLDGAYRPYRTFVESMNDGAVTLSKDGTIAYCNRQFVDFLGTPLEQTIGLTFLSFVAAEDRLQIEMLLRQELENSFRAELLLQCAYGSAIPVRLSARRLSDKSAVYWCGIVTDLRGEKLQHTLRESEGRLRVFASTLEQRVQERTRELIASRERLRALANELNMTEQRERKRMARELHDYPAQLLALSIMKLAQIKQQQGMPPVIADLIYKVQDLIVEALNYTRTLVSDLCPPMLDDLGFQSALRWLAEQMKRHQLSVTIDMRQEDIKLPGEHALLLFQSVRELLINVSKHSGAEEATVSLCQHGDELRIEVQDSGVGFDTYTKSGGVNGANFGLFSIRERMQALGGSLELESAAEKGTKATLVLPLVEVSGKGLGVRGEEAKKPEISHKAPRMSEGRSEYASPLTPHASRRVRVMLVDDHAMVRQGLRSLLDSYTDIEVVGEASNGEEALVDMATQQPEIVVMDINMPKMNGIEATSAIRNRYPDVNVIGLSVQNGGEMQQAMLKAGAAVLLSKEAAVDQLYQTIQTVQKALPT